MRDCRLPDDAWRADREQRPTPMVNQSNREESGGTGARISRRDERWSRAQRERWSRWSKAQRERWSRWR
uniref:Uncharacterized protein n=1 Tax=Manihot esculenta TaxID=3983 RepID=A0A2C9V3Z8_MANES